MKKLFLASLLLMGVVNSVNAYVQELQIIPLEIIDPKPAGNGNTKNTPFVPTVSQDGYEIVFLSSHPAYTLNIKDGDVVVYSVVVSSTTTSVLLPSWLSGDYVLYLQPEGSSYYFYGDITL